MYEGQPIICQSIIEDNWLEFLAYTKKQYDEELQRQKKRLAALKEFEVDDRNSLVDISNVKVEYAGERRYYDINLNSFWSWYITNRVEV